MVGINPSNIRYQKINFGSYDNMDQSSMAMTPADISNDPYADKHGMTLKDHRNLLPNLEIQHKNLTPEYDYYMNPMGEEKHAHSNPHKKGSLIKTFLVLGGITGAGILLYRGRKKIGSFIRNPFKKSATKAVIEEAPRSGRNVEPKRINSATFQKYYDDAHIKAHKDGNLEALKLDNFQVLLHNDFHTVAEKRQHLLNLYELGKIYGYKDRQARITLIMPESIKGKADHIVTMFDKNRIDEVDDKLIKKIEGFKIINEARPLSDKHDMIIDSQVRHGVNAKDAEDIGNKWGRNVRDFFRNLL